MLADVDAMTRKQFAVFRHLLATEEWDYAHFVSIGLDRLQHGFWSHHDPLARPPRPRLAVQVTRSATIIGCLTTRSAGCSS